MTRVLLQTRLPRCYPIAAIRDETAHVKTFTFPMSFGSKPGQFLMVWLPGVDEIPMSVALDDGEATKITFFDVGDCTKALFTLREGGLVGLRGPFGTHYEWKPKQHLILVAGGYGAAPMYFVATEAVEDDCTVDFIVGARSAEHLLYLEEIQKLKNTTLHVATDDGSMGHKGYNTEVLEELLEEHTSRRPISICHPEVRAGRASKERARQGTGDGPPQHDISVFACGPEMMLKKISEVCAARRIECAMSLERYMKCGYGLCGNCIVDPMGLALCLDGPVVRNADAMEVADFGHYHRDAEGRKHPF